MVVDSLTREKPLKIQILIACWALLLTPLSFAHSGATGVVKERMDRMVQMGKSVKAVSEMIKGKQPFSTEAVVDHAQRLAQSAEDMTDGFPELLDQAGGVRAGGTGGSPWPGSRCPCPGRPGSTAGRPR